MQFGPKQEEWLKSLEDHPERKGKNTLGLKTGDTYTACCLGELGLIAGVCQWDKDGKLAVKDEDGGIISREYLEGVHKDLGLYTSAGMSFNTKVGDETFFALSTLNDEKMTWPEIAAHVRKNPEKYFSKSY